MAKIINYVTPFDEEYLNGGYYVAFVSGNVLIDGFAAQWGEQISIIDDPPDSGSTFTGWKYTGSSDIKNSGDIVTIYEDRVYVAQFGQSHTHSFDNWYESKSKTQHRAYCACGEYITQFHTIDETENDIGDINRKCTFCGYEELIPHTCLYTSYYTKDSSSTQHMAHCICGEFIYEAHTFDPQTGKCTKCGFDPHIHSYTNSYISISKTQHRAYCTCGEYITQSHTIVESKNDIGDIYRSCTKCNYSEYISHTCSYTNSYSQYSSTQHTAYCVCGASILAAHTFDSTNTCTKCGYHTHSYTSSYVSISSTQHRAYCICGAYTTASHTFLGGICTRCGYEEYVPPHTHSYTYSYSPYSTTQHLSYCSCGPSILESHTFNSSNTCTKCGYQAVHTHSYTYSYSPYTTTQHLAYCSCGDYILASHSFHPVTGSCRQCGYNPMIGMRAEDEVDNSPIQPGDEEIT